MTPENKISLHSYDTSAEKLTEIYNNLNPTDVLPLLEGKLKSSFTQALDLGCGSGRDAHWLAEEKGYDVMALDASEQMIALARKDKSHPRIRYEQDFLPGIETARTSGRNFDVVLMSAVWMHLNSAERELLLKNLSGITNKDGLIYISLREGPSPADRPMFPVSVEEVARIAHDNAMSFEYLDRIEDKQGRGDVTWSYVALSPT